MINLKSLFVRRKYCTINPRLSPFILLVVSGRKSIQLKISARRCSFWWSNDNRIFYYPKLSLPPFNGCCSRSSRCKLKPHFLNYQLPTFALNSALVNFAKAPRSPSRSITFLLRFNWSTTRSWYCVGKAPH